MTNAFCLILLFVAVLVGGTYIGTSIDGWGGLVGNMAFSFAGGCAVGHLGYEVFG